MSQATPDDAPQIFEMCERVKAGLRRLETFPRPVVAAINGAALGGGLEIALAANHRVAVARPLRDRPARGHARAAARRRRGHPYRPDARAAAGADGRAAAGAAVQARGRPRQGPGRRGRRHAEELLPAAKAWIAAHPDAAPEPVGRPAATRCRAARRRPPRWRSSCRRSRRCSASSSRAPTTPPSEAILSAAVEGAQVDFDTASRIESRYLTKLIVNQNSKNMIQAFFFDLQAINAGSLRPAGSSRGGPPRWASSAPG